MLGGFGLVLAGMLLVNGAARSARRPPAPMAGRLDRDRIGVSRAA
jgi:hypothetical protein